MGLFEKEKTSLDYLKSIADSQKQQANSQKQQAKAEPSATRSASQQDPSQRQIAMLMRRQHVTLGTEHFKCIDQNSAHFLHACGIIGTAFRTVSNW